MALNGFQNAGELQGFMQPFSHIPEQSLPGVPDIDVVSILLRLTTLNSINLPLPVTATVLLVLQVESIGKPSWKGQGQLCDRCTEAG